VPYTIDVREIQSQPLAAVRVTSTPSEFVPAISPALGQVYGYLKSHNIAPSGPPIVVYHTFEPDRVVFDAGTPVVAAIEGDGPVESRELPSGRVAVTQHVGPYAELRGAYDALRQWAADRGEKLVGPTWEVYWMPPGGEPNESKLVTEVYWKIGQ
jgi:effector-binding domain-containing protein